MSSHTNLPIASKESNSFIVLPNQTVTNSKLLLPAKRDNENNCANMTNDYHDKRFDSRQRPSLQSPVTVIYGPIHVTVRQSIAPTLATGRLSKFVKLEGDAALKREVRRKRNREAARKLKEKRAQIEEELRAQVYELESKEQDLLLRVRNLESYKQYLEVQYQQQIVSLQTKLVATEEFSVRQVERSPQINQSVPVHHNNTRVKREPRSPSPNWQHVFSI